jgi:hypothetical protein
MSCQQCSYPLESTLHPNPTFRDFATRMRNGQERGFARQGLLMPDKTYLIRFNEADIVPLSVIAQRVETYGDHLAFLRADGRLAALILADIVEEWFEVLA